jgi:hypothetical protein
VGFSTEHAFESVRVTARRAKHLHFDIERKKENTLVWTLIKEKKN